MLIGVFRVFVADSNRNLDTKDEFFKAGATLDTSIKDTLTLSSHTSYAKAHAPYAPHAHLGTLHKAL